MATNTHYGTMHIEWRVYICCWVALQAKRLGADFIECGVNTGILSRAVMEYIDFASMSARFYLLDTYNGIPVDDLAEHEAHLASDNAFYPDCYADVLRTFAPFRNARVIRGRVPDTFDQVESDRFGYASIDMNHVAPELAAGEFLWPRLVSGAFVILDDYGWRNNFAQKQAWDAFAAEKGVSVLSLPTGQGLLMKP
ncbi:MAG: class I SAM-dependent methyltransferase [Mycobacterium sp.]|nr:class I SAM-dependent methyltransferase [Mycobacterium sp.]